MQRPETSRRPSRLEGRRLRKVHQSIFFGRINDESPLREALEHRLIFKRSVSHDLAVNLPITVEDVQNPQRRLLGHAENRFPQRKK